MATEYSITIKMDQPTVDKLRNERWSLYGFKAVRSAQSGGSPLVWFSSRDFLEIVKISWTEKYEAYIASGEIQTEVQITAASTVEADLGQKVTVSPTGGLNAVRGEQPTAITIDNEGKTEWICGISQRHSNETTPLCAFPLHGHSADVIAPIEKVVLMFAAATVKTSTVVEKAYGEGALIDLTKKRAVEVTYGINTGWELPEDVEGKVLPVDTKLVPFLISVDDSLRLPR